MIADSSDISRQIVAKAKSYGASLAAQYAVGSISSTASRIIAADVSGNDSVSAADYSWISRKAADSGVTFPVER